MLAEPITKERLDVLVLVTCTCILTQMGTHTHVLSAKQFQEIVFQIQLIILSKKCKKKVALEIRTIQLMQIK